MGLGRLGATSRAGSGDIFIAFSTAHLSATSENELSTVTMFPNNLLSGLFEATAQATEEAVVNAMVAAKTMVGINGTRVPELPEETLAEIMSAHAASQ
jgi:L-aminopeptidase/D-esterase-like protein